MASFSFCNYPLEGDGFNENIFHYLWSKDERDHSPKIWIPDTIIYKYRHPTYWYFTSKSGRIKKKSKFNLVNSKIEEAFTKKTYGSDILACYISSEDSEGNGKDSIGTIEYFDRDGLVDFLYNREKVNNGVLQRFVEPKELYNSLIRTIWSPKVVLLERRENVRKLNDTKYSLYERAITYEGAEHNSRVAPVRGNLLPMEIQKLANKIVDHITEVSFGKSNVSRMAINLKIDPNDRIWFLWCSSLRLEGRELVSSKLRIKKASDQGPVTVDSMCRVPDRVKQCISSTTTSGMSTDSLTVCTSCAKMVLSDRFYHVPYKTVIHHFEQVMSVMLAASGGRFIAWPPSKEVVEAIGGVGFGPLEHRSQSAKPKEKAAASAQQLEAETEVSPIIRKLHPSLTVEDYRRYKRDPLFQYKQVSVCESCYLVFAEVATCNSGAAPSGTPGDTTSRITRVLLPPKSADELWGSQGTSRRTAQLAQEVRQPRKAAARSKPVPRVRTEPDPGRVMNPLLSGAQGPAMPPRIDEKSVKELQEVAVLRQARAELVTPLERPRSRSSEAADSGRDTSASFQSVLQRREDSFFRDLYNNPNLKNGHPLQHLVQNQRKVDGAYAGISNAKLAGSLLPAQVPALVKTSSQYRTGAAPAGFSQARSVMKSPYASHTSKRPSKRVSRVFEDLEGLQGHQRRQETKRPQYRMVRGNQEQRAPPRELMQAIQDQPTSRASTAESKQSAGSGRSVRKKKAKKKTENKKGTAARGSALSENESAALHRSFLLNTLQEVRSQLEATSPFVNQPESIVPERELSGAEHPMAYTRTSTPELRLPGKLAFRSNHKSYYAVVKEPGEGVIPVQLLCSPEQGNRNAIELQVPVDILKGDLNKRDAIVGWLREYLEAAEED